MRGYSTAIGSFTFMIISARAHTSSTGRSCAPTDEYCSSSKPLPSPPPCSTSTVWPACTSASAPAGTSAMRFSLVLISFGTPMIIVGFAFAVEEAGPAEAVRAGAQYTPPAPFGETARRSPSPAAAGEGLRVVERPAVSVDGRAPWSGARVLLRRGRRAAGLVGDLLQRGLAREAQAALLVDREELHLHGL